MIFQPILYLDAPNENCATYEDAKGNTNWDKCEPVGIKNKTLTLIELCTYFTIC